ncbi:hypothetical protein OEZ85_001079 [Tetradesmus obliquus]|uniref:Uncharacterized protein n=1 Tax=Tetradesmus obliquus TaxID=3088 RepID=A0ABY8UQT5_TETOB|nr:hypothetical protein OEZ85_001079 [Tetradesmus obliquus]
MSFPRYEGSQEGGQPSEAECWRPHTVVLLGHIEQESPHVFSRMCQLLLGGYSSSMCGAEDSLLIVLSSNVAASFVERRSCSLRFIHPANEQATQTTKPALGRQSLTTMSPTERQPTTPGVIMPGGKQPMLKLQQLTMPSSGGPASSAIGSKKRQLMVPGVDMPPGGKRPTLMVQQAGTAPDSPGIAQLLAAAEAETATALKAYQVAADDVKEPAKPASGGPAKPAIGSKKRQLMVPTCNMSPGGKRPTPMVQQAGTAPSNPGTASPPQQHAATALAQEAAAFQQTKTASAIASDMQVTQVTQPGAANMVTQQTRVPIKCLEVRDLLPRRIKPLALDELLRGRTISQEPKSAIAHTISPALLNPEIPAGALSEPGMRSSDQAQLLAGAFGEPGMRSSDQAQLLAGALSEPGMRSSDQAQLLAGAFSEPGMRSSDQAQLLAGAESETATGPKAHQVAADDIQEPAMPASSSPAIPAIASKKGQLIVSGVGMPPGGKRPTLMVQQAGTAPSNPGTASVPAPSAAAPFDPVTKTTPVAAAPAEWHPIHVLGLIPSRSLETATRAQMSGQEAQHGVACRGGGGGRAVAVAAPAPAQAAGSSQAGRPRQQGSGQAPPPLALSPWPSPVRHVDWCRQLWPRVQGRRGGRDVAAKVIEHESVVEIEVELMLSISPTKVVGAAGMC